MRWMCWAAAVLAACLSAEAAAGSQAAGTAGCACNGTYGTPSAPACCFWGFGLVQGCCETRPTSCDHVWDTYCQGRAYRLQRHSMRRAAHPPPVPYAQPVWGDPAGMIGQPTPASPGNVWSPGEPLTPMPDAAATGKGP